MFLADTPARVGQEGWSLMAEKIQGMSTMPKKAVKTRKPEVAYSTSAIVL